MSLTKPIFDVENGQLLKYLISKSKYTKSPLILRRLCRDFNTRLGSKYTDKKLAERIGRDRERIHELPDVDNVTKAKMMFALRAPVNREFLELLRKTAEIDVDDRNRILKYQSSDGEVSLAFEERYDEENEDFIKFLHEESKNANSPIHLGALVQKFKEKSKSNRAKSVFLEKIVEYRQKIPEIKELDLDEKARMLFALSASVEPDFLKKLKLLSYVEVDHLNRIVKYESDKGLKLCGIHFFQNETLKVEEDKKKKGKKMPTKRQHHDSNEDWDDDDDWGSKKRKKPAPQRPWGIRRIPQKKQKASEVPVEMSKMPVASEWMPSPETPEELAARLLEIERCRVENLCQKTPKNEEIEDEKPMKNSVSDWDTRNNNQKLIKDEESELEIRDFVKKTLKRHDQYKKPAKIVRFCEQIADIREFCKDDILKSPKEEEVYDPKLVKNLKVLTENLKYGGKTPEIEEIEVDSQSEIEPQKLKITPNAIWRRNQFDDLYCTLPISERKPIDRYVDVEKEKFGSSLKFVRAVGDLLDLVYTEKFADMKKRIDEAEERLGKEDKPALLETISISLHSVLLAIRNSSKPAEESPENAKPLFGILVMLWGIPLSLYPSKLDDFTKAVTDSMLAAVKNEDKNVPIQALRTVLDALLLTIVV